MENQHFDVALRLDDGFRMAADFGLAGVPELFMDEPPPLGGGQGPNPARLLATALGNCLSASLLFCLHKSRVQVNGLSTRVRGTMVRNERGRWRIGSLAVSIHPDVPAEDQHKLARCLDLFEDFCVIGGSIREGIAIDVEVDSAHLTPT
jgi:organic hydroperoxide reductase OsmC/OhrA